ncbi:aminopeptidase N [Halieaceae bacterium IMCC14734]|uniref:Aminopeptidase N n=1 Tax=Candidatus Litorirhabdus singularis TaxID=2518993 RepID=A0ABT3TER9_9GAMM|nr:aminopeptidase N [Candidatus Litorirhabdus singularis]MCX2979922.1 aminopeptidase N [Candidatus Litorirhabdus singularis]
MPGVSVRQLLLLALIGFCASCSEMPQQPNPLPQREAGSWLSEIEAQRRAASVSNLSYTLAITLEATPTRFAGEAILEFDYQASGAPLTIDFHDGQIHQLTVNGEETKFSYNGAFISLNERYLRAGSNRLTITYDHAYSRDGTGLYRYQDPLDDAIYLYTNLEPWGANRVFPHFDQPDLKASFTLQVTAPAEWLVVSSVRESNINASGEQRIWQFPTSAIMSSYVFSLHAGDYRVWEDADFRYPLRLLARQSQAEYIDPELWFDYTRRGFDFFDDYFKFPYPFLKYDQLLVPDFNHGAMENIGAVTFSERFIHRTEPTLLRKQSLAKTIYHEMAHMWFGDLTTMVWWNGLWLNESFASLMAYLALEPQPEFDGAGLDFLLGFKQWAYAEDQLVTTHPIDLPVADTAVAENIFDGITYGKGAASLKQLHARLGAEVFQRGVSDYLAANAYGNTTLEDFMSSLSAAAATPLDEWTDQWLRQPGLNSVEARLQCRGGKIRSLELIQSAPTEHPVLREHQLEVALYDKRAGKLELRQSIPVLLRSQRTSVASVNGEDCPDLVYPNYRDLAYIKVNLDSRSLNVVRHHINTVAQPLQRAMLWQDLWAMVQDRRLSLAQYLQIVEANLAGESNLRLVGSILGTVARSYAWLEIMPGGYEEHQRSARVLEPLMWRAVQRERGDARKTWLDGYIRAASNAKALDRLRSLLEEPGVDGVELDQDRRWNALRQLAGYRCSGCKQLIEQESRRDNSDNGQRRYLAAQVALAPRSEKATWREQALRVDDNYRLNHSRIILQNLHPAPQRHEMSAALLLTELEHLDQSRDQQFMRYLSPYLIPTNCSQQNAKALVAFLSQKQPLSPALDTQLRKTAQLEQRCADIADTFRQQQLQR